MRIIAISDTHGQHRKLRLPEGDVLIHAGDISHKGHDHEILDFIEWFGQQDYQWKVFIAGNHDFFFERKAHAEIAKLLPDQVHYLNDSGIEINGIHIWGSPITPWFYDWAFNRHRGEHITRHWDLIPTNTDVLITHGPMFKRLDQNTEGKHVGCEDLLHKSKELKLQAHIFGHIHEGHGMIEKQKIKFLNASVLNERYELVNKPLVLDI